MQLISRQVDAVITDAFPGTQGAPGGGIHTTVIGQDPVRGYLPHGVPFVDFDQLKEIRWVAEPPDSASSQWALRVCRELGIEPVIAHVSSDLLFHLRMVEQGLAAAFLPDMVVREARQRRDAQRMVAHGPAAQQSSSSYGPDPNTVQPCGYPRGGTSGTSGHVSISYIYPPKSSLLFTGRRGYIGFNAGAADQVGGMPCHQ